MKQICFKMDFQNPQDALYSCQQNYTMAYITSRADVVANEFHLTCGNGATYPESPSWVTCLPLCMQHPVRA